LANVNVILGKGAFKNADEYSSNGDIFGFTDGSKKYQGVVAPVVAGSGTDVLAPHAESEPVFKKDLPLDLLP